ncbi:MAG TPA: FAD-dependent oxidoreductase, partial [Nitrospira sp.]|nr:FAD-dependent oxidoreductase [Nitrospira sp.]
MPENGDLEGVNEPVITLNAEIDWDDEAEVVVVGSGIAGCSVAINCAVQGASVLVLEKSGSTGGTSAKSGAGALVPNNRFLRQAGRETESKADFIGLLARLGRPALYDTSHPTFGLPQWEYDLIETYYDNAEEAWSYMEDIDAVKVMHFPDWPSYNDIPEEKYPFGRMIFPCDDDGQLAFGREAIDRLVRKATALGAKLLTGFGVTGVYVNQVGEIVGVRGFSDGEVRSVRALRSVVFSTGGFTHSSQYAREYLNGQIVGGCAARTNTGDFIPIAKALGAPLFQMNSAFLAPLVYEQAIDKDPDLVTNFNFAGDSGLVVNKYGVRVGNEKAQYNDRTQSHYVWDAHRAEYPNFLQFGIIDQRTRENFGYSGRGDYQAGNFIPSPGESSKYLIEAETIP